MLWGAFGNFTLDRGAAVHHDRRILLRLGHSRRRCSPGSTSGLRRFPGGLLHTNIASSALFCGHLGSSVATAATISTVAIPQMEPGGYKAPPVSWAPLLPAARWAS